MRYFRRGKPSPGSHCVARHPFKRGNIPRNAPILFLGLSLLFIFLLLLLPTGFEGAYQFKDAIKCKVEILEVDNSSLIDTGLIRTGQQVCKVRFLNGKFRDKPLKGGTCSVGHFHRINFFILETKLRRWCIMMMGK